jgi:hypothetical protein
VKACLVYRSLQHELSSGYTEALIDLHPFAVAAAERGGHTKPVGADSTQVALVALLDVTQKLTVLVPAEFDGQRALWMIEAQHLVVVFTGFGVGTSA